MSQKTVDKTAEELDNVDTTQCDGYCGDTVLQGETVDVVAGEVVDRYDENGDYPPHLAVTGVDGKFPELEQWCATCAESEYGIKKTRQEQTAEIVSTRLTRSNIKSFSAGLALGLLVLVFFLIFLP